MRVLGMVALLAAVVAGRLLAPPATAKKPSAKAVVATAKNATEKAVSKTPTVLAKSRTLTEEEEVQRLQQGLSSISKLRSIFTSKEGLALNAGAGKFANGAMSDELSKQDSDVWSAISSMVGMAESVSAKMKNAKTKDEKAKLMDGLQNQMNEKATVLSKVTAKVSVKQREEDEEYVLGLLNMHRKDWDIKEQLNATATFMKNSPLLAKLYKNHTEGPLAPQLAAMMDSEKTKTAAKMFLQLAQGLRM